MANKRRKMYESYCTLKNILIIIHTDYFSDHSVSRPTYLSDLSSSVTH